MVDVNLNAAIGWMWKLQRKMIQEIAYAYVKKNASDYNSWIGASNRQQICADFATALENVGMADQIGYLSYFQSKWLADQMILSYFAGNALNAHV